MKYRHLTQSQRFIIEEMLRLDQSVATIAKYLKVHRTTIWREIRRNSAPKGYNGLGAQRSARSRRPHICFYKRKIVGQKEDLVVERLREGWSPEQIANRLRLEKGFKISHEAVYRFIAMDRRTGGNLYQFLRRSRSGRRRWISRKKWDRVDRVFIARRPSNANERTELGHWERDLMCGAQGKGAILTIVDRKSRYTKLELVRSFSPTKVNQATGRALCGKICRTITNDNGFEFRRFDELKASLKTEIYFTDPYSSWQRGTVENTNGLLRQFFPKQTDFLAIEDWKVKKAEEYLNNRPRKILGWRTPHEIFFNEQQKLLRKCL